MSDNIIKLSEKIKVPPAKQVEHYKSTKIIYIYDPLNDRWRYTIERTKVVVVRTSGDCKTLPAAKRKSHSVVDKLIEDRKAK